MSNFNICLFFCQYARIRKLLQIRSSFFSLASCSYAITEIEMVTPVSCFLTKRLRFPTLIKALEGCSHIWAVSSAVEYRSYKPGVTGSNPVPPTRENLIIFRGNQFFSLLISHFVFDNYYFKINVLRMQKFWRTYKANKRKIKKEDCFEASSP
jgi:hypothetical protein